MNENGQKLYLHILQNKQHLAILLTRAVELHQVLSKLSTFHICSSCTDREYFCEAQTHRDRQGHSQTRQAGIDMYMDTQTDTFTDMTLSQRQTHKQARHTKRPAQTDTDTSKIWLAHPNN